jgi:hypothetical protein
MNRGQRGETIIEDKKDYEEFIGKLNAGKLPPIIGDPSFIADIKKTRPLFPLSFDIDAIKLGRECVHVLFAIIHSRCINIKNMIF